MEQFELVNEDVRGLPMTPARWIGVAKYTPITKVRMTCGGGVGGAQWFEYIKTKEMPKADELFVAERWDGKEIVLNPRYIVEMENFMLCERKYNSQNHNYPIGEYTDRFMVEPLHRVVFKNEFIGRY